MPKQLLPLIEGRSLLQLAYERAALVVDPDRILVCASASYADVIGDQLPQLPRSNMLCEPVGRDSLAAIAWSVATIARRDPSAVVAILSADQTITPLSAFADTMARAFQAASDDDQGLVTLGVVPTSAHTGFGYVHVADAVSADGLVHRVGRFAEKPSLEVAQRYLSEGDWWWNSGIFVWQAKTFMAQVELFQPEMAAQIGRLVSEPELIDQVYPTLNRVSVDYAIMEPVSQGRGTAHVLSVALNARWTDVGGFAALAGQLPADEDNNVLRGTVVALECSDTLVLSDDPEHLVAVAGLKDMIVVQEGNVTLVCAIQAAQSIKQLVELAREAGEQYV
jgi:mannose-1-phosphate guanylyltransferase